MATKKELLEQARSLGLKPVTRNTVEELTAMIDEVEAAAKAAEVRKPRTTGLDPNVEVERLMEAIHSGVFEQVMEANDLTPGKLARLLGVEPAVVSKIVTGKRAPRPSAAPDSIAGKLGAWFAEATIVYAGNGA